MTKHVRQGNGGSLPRTPGGPGSPGREEGRPPGGGGSGLVAHSPVEDPVVTARALSKIFGRGENAVTALDAVDVSIARARFTAIMGPSGSGKSTLMHCLAGLESATSGTITLDGQEITSMSQRRLTKLRRERIGFIFQSFNLVPSLTAGENITLPLDIARKKVNPQRPGRRRGGAVRPPLPPARRALRRAGPAHGLRPLARGAPRRRLRR